MNASGRPFDLVIFDLDGTLVDSLPDIARALNVALASYAIPPLAQESVARFVGDGAAKLIERAAPPPRGDAAMHASLLSRFVEAYAAAVCVHSRLYPGVSELLSEIRARGIAAAVLTNKPGALARDLLTGLGIADAFLSIIGDGDGFPRKPDPAAARALIGRAGTVVERVAVVGDGIPDLRLARALGATSIAAEWGYVDPVKLQAEGPTYRAAAVSELAGWLLPVPPPRTP